MFEIWTIRTTMIGAILQIRGFIPIAQSTRDNHRSHYAQYHVNVMINNFQSKFAQIEHECMSYAVVQRKITQ